MIMELWNLLKNVFVTSLGLVHISKDVAYDNYYVVMSSIYQVPIFKSLGMHWMVIACRYNFFGDNVMKKSEETMVTLGIAILVANKIVHVVEVKQESLVVKFESMFPHVEVKLIELSNSFDEGNVIQLLYNIYVESHVPLASISTTSQNVCEPLVEPSISCPSIVQSVVNNLKIMFQILHVLVELKSLNYNIKLQMSTSSLQDSMETLCLCFFQFNNPWGIQDKYKE
jgi:hypothetical protein